MKNLITRLITLTLICALAFSFAACDMTWDAPPVTQTPEEAAATQQLKEKHEALTTLFASETLPGTEYTKTSVEEARAAYNALDLTAFEGNGVGQTVEAINALIAQLDEVSAKLVKVDEMIQNRIKNALLGIHHTDEEGNLKYYHYDNNGDWVETSKETEGATPWLKTPNTGVEYIEYNEETRIASFYLSENADETYLTNFLETGVAELFMTAFNDVAAVEYTAEVYKDAAAQEAQQKTVETFTMSGLNSLGAVTYLAAGLLCVCAGDPFSQNLYNAVVNGSSLGLGGLTSKTYSIISGKSCSANVTFYKLMTTEDEITEEPIFDYIFTTNFGVNFISYQTI